MATTNKSGLMVVSVAILVAGIIFAACGQKEVKPQTEVIKISGAYALYPMMTLWVQEYRKVQPNVKIEVSGGGAGKGMADCLGGLVQIGMVSREVKEEEKAKGAFPIAVVKDAVIPTINAANPVREKLAARGLTREEFEAVFITRKIKTWGELVGDPSIKDPIKVYTRADSCGAAETWAKYLGKYTQEDLTKNADAGIMNDPDLAAAVTKDRLGIGYNNINFTYDVKTSQPLPGIAPCPIDVNGDGTLNPEENFYATQTQLLEAIGTGKYPSPPARDLYVVGKGGFSGATLQFVKWILTDGQKYVAAGGYIPLPQEKLAAELAKLPQ